MVLDFAKTIGLISKMRFKVDDGHMKMPLSSKQLPSTSVHVESPRLTMMLFQKIFRHDAPAVRENVNIVLEHHKEQGTEFNKIYQYTDGCSHTIQISKAIL